MADSLNTTQVQQCLDRLRAGDAAARNELIARASNRLERLAHRMLRGQFERLGRWVDTGDVLQSAVARLCATLTATTPETPLHFLRLGALHVRRELLDLSRHFYGPRGQGANHGTAGPDVGGSFETPPVLNPADSAAGPPEQAQIAELHERVKELPAEEAEITDLLFYQELTQEEAAELLGIDVRTVQRRWQRARRRLGALLQEDSDS